MQHIDYRFPRGLQTISAGRDGRTAHQPHLVAAFLHELLQTDNLAIDEYLPRMNRDAFFLVAATGLGKTVAVPPHVWLRQCERAAEGAPDHAWIEDGPRLWVVEPRIPIAEEQAAYMNSLYWGFKRRVKQPPKSKRDALFGSITSNQGRVNGGAPIMFITTGILSLMARGGELDALRDRVIIDEAHVTIEQNPDVELAIGIARRDGVTVDYMSATIDAGNIQELLGVENIIQADKQRYPVWLHNLGESLEDCIADVVNKVLVERDTSSSLLPGRSYRDYARVMADLFSGPRRASGMLVVVNSFSGEASDAVRVAKVIREAPYNRPTPGVEVLLLASKIVRNPAAFKAFNAQLARIEAAKLPYVVVATSVVEMGVTFPTLDFVVTMDSGYENMTLGDRQVPVLVPLGVNALKQRVGRVGRRRSGIGYITREVGAPYTDLSDKQLNNGALAYEPLRPPLASAPLTSLAFYALEQGWETGDDFINGLEALCLPSRKWLFTQERIHELFEEVDRLQQYGLGAIGHGVSPLGELCEKWIGSGDLAYAVKLQQSLAFEKPYEYVTLFWAVAMAASHTSIGSLLRQNGSFTPDARQLSAYGAPPIAFRRDSELIALYEVVRFFATRYGAYCGGSKLGSLRQGAEGSMYRACERQGLEFKRVRFLLDAVDGTLQLFCDVNYGRDEYRSLYGDIRRLDLGTPSWPPLNDKCVKYLRGEVVAMKGRKLLQTRNTGGIWEWIVDGEPSGIPLNPSRVLPDLSGGAFCTGKHNQLLNFSGAQSHDFIHLEIVDVED